jgi:hypothetical protein
MTGCEQIARLFLLNTHFVHKALTTNELRRGAARPRKSLTANDL